MFTQISVYFNSFLIKAILRKVQINIRKSKLNESNVMVAEVLVVGAQEVVGAVRVPQEVVATTAAVPQEVVAVFVVPHEVAAVVELVVVPREVVAAVVQPQEMVAAGVLVALPRGQRGELQASQ